MRKAVVYFVDERGKNPVAEFIEKLMPDERVKCLEYIAQLENYGEEVRRPLGDYLGDKLYELRPKQNRILYAFFMKDHVVLLHAFRKKTNAVPKEHLAISKVRMANVIKRFESGKIII